MTTYSFIIPHHNNPELLNRCLASIPMRDDIQIIVVDDNSRPDRQPIVTRNDVELYHIDNQHTKGAGCARNVGMTKAVGKWLLFADCDDCYSEGFLDVLDRFADQDIDVLYFNFTVLDFETQKIKADQELQVMIDSYDGSATKSEHVKFRNNSPWTKMVSRSFVERNGISFEEVPNGNDAFFALMVAVRCCKFAVTPERVYQYMITSNSICTKKKSPSDVWCRLAHYFKHNYVKKSLGHSDWNIPLPLFVRILLSRETLLRRFYLAIVIIVLLPMAYSRRKEWLSAINS